MQIFSSDNFAIITKAVAMSLFYTGTGMAFKLLLPKNSWTTCFSMLALSILILMLDDGKLTELYQLRAKAPIIQGSMDRRQK